MSWVKLDDQFFAHPKVRAAGARATLLYLAGLTYCARYLTDGAIPKTALAIIAAESFSKPSDAALLITAGLWHDEGDHYEAHDYLELNPSREQVESERERRSQAGRIAAGKRWASESHSESHTIRHRNPDAPVPSHPVPKGQTRAQRIPDDFDLSAAREGWARERCPGLDVVLHHERFVNYWTSQTGKAALKSDWDKTWRNWMLKEFAARPLAPAVSKRHTEPTAVLPPSEAPMCETCLRSVLACECVSASANGRGK